MSEWIKRPTPMGGAGGFHTFFKDELIPLIEHEYQVNPKRRILAGHSFGGLFATYALLKQPDLFHTHIIASPSLVYGDQYIFKLEEAFARKHKRLRVRAHFPVGEHEEYVGDPMVTEMLRFIDVLENRQYKGLQLAKRISMDLDHCEAAAPGFHGGLIRALRN